ncbi:MAG: YdcF family protein [Polaromonas sp.]|nr:YdcF family protein [Polaromonas sp.]
MEFGSLKPVLSSLLMPLAFLPLLSLLGLVLVARRKHGGWLLSILAFVGLWLLSCQGTAVWLAQTALPQYPPVTAAQLKAGQVEAIVVLGGGTYPQAPEYGVAQPDPSTAARLRYGIWLSKRSDLPIAFSGGSGWAAGSNVNGSEAEVAGRVALEDYGITLRWVENQSRDTAENAKMILPLLKRDGITRIALVTDALHMPRAMVEFERTGLAVTAAPTGFALPTKSGVLQWLPTTDGLSSSTRLIHEVLGLTATTLR